ncbi:UDP-rhamnose/UDP-galactose transporter 3-like isoform X2 [Magnolia sinica]|uniref:UDP-rhamnose/UDP-galactose transporter 3-like isoform X2 n=1 Tax=Magnolia sinica TaxID=86752 RepID=UPI002659766C|nr:UDP-rhamnose/UDP-galactose transporter 3-like isoform X2 [Magnolia sinica]
MIPRNGKSNSDVLVKSQMLLLEAREDSSLNDKTIDSFDGNTFCILLMPVFNGDFQTSLLGNSTTKVQFCVEAMTLTGFHFAVTALVGLVSNATSHSASKHVPLWELLWFSIVANMSITGMNLSLMLNSVGFYQISKLSMILVVCVMEWILHSKRYSREVKMAVIVVVVGVGVCTVTDVKVNAKGFLCACVAVFATSLQQIVPFTKFIYWNGIHADTVLNLLDSSSLGNYSRPPTNIQH